jgi:ABC-type sugar transport system substrate-binding protein
MRRGRGFFGWGTVLMALLVAPSGCGSDAFAPPAPPELSVVTSMSSTTRAPAVTLILRSEASEDRDIWTVAAQTEAGETKTVLLVERPRPTDPPEKQAELIRSAAKNKVSAIVIEPDDAPQTAEALHSAAAQGIPVVLLMKELASGDSAKPFHVVAFAPYDDSVKQLIRGVVNEARSSGLPADGHAIVLHNTTVGPVCDKTVELLRKGLGEAAIPVGETIHINEVHAEGGKVLLRVLDADPKISMIFAADAVGLSVANAAAVKVKDKRGLSIGGCQTVDRLYAGYNMPSCAGVIDRNISALTRSALRTALRLSRGESVPTKQFLPIRYVPNTSAAKSAVEEPPKKPATPETKKE